MTVAGTAASRLTHWLVSVTAPVCLQVIAVVLDEEFDWRVDVTGIAIVVNGIVGLFIVRAVMPKHHRWLITLLYLATAWVVLATVSVLIAMSFYSGP